MRNEKRGEGGKTRVASSVLMFLRSRGRGYSVSLRRSSLGRLAALRSQLPQHNAPITATHSVQSHQMQTSFWHKMHNNVRKNFSIPAVPIRQLHPWSSSPRTKHQTCDQKAGQPRRTHTVAKTHIASIHDHTVYASYRDGGASSRRSSRCIAPIAEHRPYIACPPRSSSSSPII